MSEKISTAHSRKRLCRKPVLMMALATTSDLLVEQAKAFVIAD
jgi:hypothetical protein